MNEQKESVEYLRVYALLVNARENSREANIALANSNWMRNDLQKRIAELKTCADSLLSEYLRLCEMLTMTEEQVKKDNSAHVAARAIENDLQKRIAELTSCDENGESNYNDHEVENDNNNNKT